MGQYWLRWIEVALAYTSTQTLLIFFDIFLLLKLASFNNDRDSLEVQLSAAMIQCSLSPVYFYYSKACLESVGIDVYACVLCAYVCLCLCLSDHLCVYTHSPQITTVSPWRWMWMWRYQPVKLQCSEATSLKCSSVPGTLSAICWPQGESQCSNRS